jgi:hypothetical protein
MLSSEFGPEMGALLRSLEARIRSHPNLMYGDSDDALDHLRDAIVALTAVYLSLRDNLD